MAIKRFVLSVLNLEPGEARPAGLLSAFYAALVTAFILLQATTFGLFIAEYGSQNLPYAYLTVAVLGALVAYVYLRLSERISLEKLVTYNLIFTVLMFIIYRIGLASPFQRTVIFLLPLWFQTMINLANLAVWPLAGSTFDLRQAKRLFGLVGIGNWVANVIVGLIVAPIVTLVGLPNLLYFSIGWVIVAGLIFAVVVSDRKAIRETRPAVIQPRPQQRMEPKVSPLRSPYVRRILAYVMIWWISFYFIDNIFFDRAAVTFQDGAALAGFIGRLLSLTGILALITTTFLTGRILGRFGLRAGLIAMPAIVTFLLLATALLGTFSPDSRWIFWLVALTKVVNIALGFSLSQTALTLLYQPLPGLQRGGVQTLAEGIFQPIAIGISGLMLLLFNTILRINAIGLSYIFMALAAAWLAAIISLVRHYPQALADALAHRRLGEATPDFSDPDSLAILRSSLKDPNPGVIIYALRALEANDPVRLRVDLPELLPAFLAAPAIEVRRVSLSLVERLGVDAGPQIAAHLANPGSDEIHAAMIRALKNSPNFNHIILEALSAETPQIAQAALTATLQLTPEHPQALEKLWGLTRSSAGRDRILAAEVMDALTVQTVAPQLLELIGDPDHSVRRAALLAAPGISGRKIWDAVVHSGEHIETARTSIRILAAGGQDAREAIADHLQQQDLPFREFQTLVCAVAAHGGDWANEVLQNHIRHPDPAGRAIVWEALRKNHYRSEGSTALADLLSNEINAAAVIVRGLALFEGQKDSPLGGALSGEFRSAQARTLDLLSFTLPRNRLAAAFPALLGERAEGLAYALEILETSLPSDKKPLVLPLFELHSWEARLAAWSAIGITTPGKDAADWLLQVLNHQTALHPSDWTRACLFYTAGLLDVQECSTAAQADIQAADEIVRDMAAWAFSRFVPDRSIKEGAAMLSTIEKMIILKSTEIFHRIPDHILGEISMLLDEVDIEEGTVIFQKGDFGDSMYIIANGEVRIEDAEKTLNVLDAGAVFGEMALLDPEPRMAAVIASAPTKLLRLDHADFTELLFEAPEFARGIIQMLTYRLRDVTERFRTA